MNCPLKCFLCIFLLGENKDIWRSHFGAKPPTQTVIPPLWGPECHHLNTVTEYGKQVNFRLKMSLSTRVLKVILTHHASQIGAWLTLHGRTVWIRLSLRGSNGRRALPSSWKQVVPGGRRGAGRNRIPSISRGWSCLCWVLVPVLIGTLRTLSLSATAPRSSVAACLKIVGPFPNYMCKRITWELVRMQSLWPLLPETGLIGCAQELPCTTGSCLSCSCHISLRELWLCSLDPRSSPWRN